MRRKGFTLIELIVVIAIIGVLVGLATGQFKGSTKEAELVNIQNDVKVLENKIDVERIKGKEYSEWTKLDNNEELANNKIYGIGGILEEVPEGNYLEVPAGYVQSKLPGKFYLNETTDQVIYLDVKSELNPENRVENELTKIENMIDKGNTDGIEGKLDDLQDMIDALEKGKDNDRLQAELDRLRDKLVELNKIKEIEKGLEEIGNLITNLPEDPNSTVIKEIEDLINDVQLKIDDLIDGGDKNRLQDELDSLEGALGGIDKTPPTTPILGVDTTDLASKVIVTITYSSDSLIKEYRIGTGAWVSYTSPVSVSSNTTIYARGTDAAGNVSAEGSLVITNIDEYAGQRAPDGDFEFKVSAGAPNIYGGQRGYFKYIGTKSTVILPHSINGNVLKDYYYMFADSSVTKVVSDNPNITNMAYMFDTSASTTLDLSEFNTSNVTDMEGMFSSSKATSLNLSNFNTSNVANMKSMFWYSRATTLNLSSFDTSNVVDMSMMFYELPATTLNVSSFNTSKVVDMSHMFYSAKVGTLNLSNFNTSKVTDMNNMFAKTKATLNLSSFDTSNVTNMEKMFALATITSLDLSSFNTSKVTKMSNIFGSSDLKTVYARTQADANKFEDASYWENISFVVR